MHLQEKSQARLFHFAIFVIMSVVLISADHNRKATSIRTTLNIMTYPIKVMVDLPFSTAHKVRTFFTSHAKLTRQNRELRQMVTVYAARDQKYRSIASENTRLRAALDIVTDTKDPFLMANILIVDADPFHQTVSIDKGSNQGIYEGQIALSGNSIYGQVIETSLYSATIMQLSDPKHSIPVRNSRTGEHALAVGTGKTNVVKLEHVENLEDVKTGDLYVSSGLGLLFPPDFPVAVVKEKRYSPAESMTTISASTVTDFNLTRELLLIWQSKPVTAEETQ